MDALAGYQRIELRTPLPAGGGSLSPHDLVVDAAKLDDLARRVDAAAPETLKTAFALLRNNILSTLHVTGAFSVEDDGCTPGGFTDATCDPAWWHAARTVAGLASSRGIELCSYLCENEGKLFVHLSPSSGDDRSAVKSRSRLSGHTDASALPFPGEECDHEGIAPSPDLVVLACMRNPGGTQTRFAPLSVIHQALDADTIQLLQEPAFDFRPQASFDMAPNFVNAKRPVLLRDQAVGLMIRFSHSNVEAGDNEGATALENLKAAIAGAFGGIALEPGDILFVNNRTALHGRSEVATAEGAAPRWLLRTYGTYARRAEHAADAGMPYALTPRGGGPAARTRLTGRHRGMQSGTEGGKKSKEGAGDG